MVMQAGPEPTPATAASPSGALPGFLLLYVGLYSAYGSESAYLPAFLGSHGLAVEWIGLVLAVGTGVRIVTGPAAGHLADRLQARKRVLTLAAAASGAVGSAYLFAYGLLPLLIVGVVHAAATACLAPLSDALALAAASEGRGFQYGWVRGTGSAAFVGGTLLSGQLVDRYGLSSIIFTSSALFVVMAVFAARVRAPREQRPSAHATSADAFLTLWNITAYRRLLCVAFLVIGSHALNDTFAVIAWRKAGFGSWPISLLWSESVVAEVLVFFWAGPWLIAKLGPARAAGLSTVAGIVRWSVMGSTASMPALICTQALHGLTFALLHLAAMAIIARTVPDRLAATAQALYGTFALGIASALLTFGSGYLYGWFGMHAFWAMASTCALALPMLPGLASAVSKPVVREP